MADDQKVRDAQLKQSIQQKLIESGEYERLKEILRQKLIDSGWRDELKEHTMSAPPPPPLPRTPLRNFPPRPPLTLACPPPRRSPHPL